MDDLTEVSDFTTTITAPEARDENKSPTTSGSSSEAFAEDVPAGAKRNRRPRRHPRPKRKKTWKPYSEMSWDEKRDQDDRESRRAFAKRERLSAEGHPIAPYNTTQFLMDDRKVHNTHTESSFGGSPKGINNNSKNVDEKIKYDKWQQQPDVEKDRQNLRHVTRMVGSDSSKSLLELDESNVDDLKVAGGKSVIAEQLQFRVTTDSPLLTDGVNYADSELGEDIQRYIMNDFTDMYAGIHAEQLQSMTKPDLVDECLKLERRVDVLEKRVKDCKKKHKYDLRGRTDLNGRTDAHLLEKINLLQAQNAQLMKDNAVWTSQKGAQESASSKPVSADGASIDDEQC